MTDRDFPDQKTESVAGFDEAAFRALTAADPASPGLRAVRDAGYAAYDAAPMPVRQMDEWRRTDPAMFPFSRMARLPELVPGACAPHPWDEEFDAVISVEDDRFEIRDRTGAIRDGRVRVEPLSVALAERGGPAELFAKAIAGRVPVDRLEALADAFWNVGFYIGIAPMAELERGILLRVRHTREKSILIPRIWMESGPGSRATVVEDFGSPDGAEVFSVFSRELRIGEKAVLRTATLRGWGDRTAHLATDRAKLGRGARLEWVTLNLGGRRVKARFECDAAEPGAQAELDGLFVASGDGHVDQKTLQAHSSPDTVSRLLYKGVAKDRAHSVYQGEIIALPGAVRVDAYQRNNNLVLNEGARADAVPSLRIAADDLKCSHGATTGNLNEEELYYLRCRGLDPAAARAMLIRGFMEEVAARIPSACVREDVQRRMDAAVS